MTQTILSRVEQFAPTWLRYMYTLSEISRTGQGWVVATGDDIALWDTDGGAVLPMWPNRNLAEQVAEGDAEASPVTSGEIVERLLPFLAQNDASISLFPNFEDDMLIEPDAVAEDLADFVADPVDVSAQLTQAPLITEYEEWALLEVPEGIEEDADEAWKPTDEPFDVVEGDAYATAIAAAVANGGLWLLDDPAEDAVVGVVLDDRPGLAVFATSEAAMAWGADVDADVRARPVGVDELLGGWLLVGYGAGWSIAIEPSATGATFVEPTRMTLDLAEALETVFE